MSTTEYALRVNVIISPEHMSGPDIFCTIPTQDSTRFRHHAHDREFCYADGRDGRRSVIHTRRCCLKPRLSNLLRRVRGSTTQSIGNWYTSDCLQCELDESRVSSAPYGSNLDTVVLSTNRFTVCAYCVVEHVCSRRRSIKEEFDNFVAEVD